MKSINESWLGRTSRGRVWRRAHETEYLISASDGGNLRRISYIISRDNLDVSRDSYYCTRWVGRLHEDISAEGCRILNYVQVSPFNFIWINLSELHQVVPDRPKFDRHAEEKKKKIEKENREIKDKGWVNEIEKALKTEVHWESPPSVTPAPAQARSWL